MNRFEIRDILNAHKEHFRVLPTGACNELLGIIDAIDTEVEAAIQSAADQKAAKKPVEKKKPVVKETPAQSLTVGKVAKKKIKKKGK